jgi:hypothetical protein
MSPSNRLRIPHNGFCFRYDGAEIKLSFDKNGSEIVEEKGDLPGLTHLYWELYEQATGRNPDEDIPADAEDPAVATFYLERCRYWQNEFYTAY